MAQEVWFGFGEVLGLLTRWERSYREHIKHPPYWTRASQNFSTPVLFPEGDSTQSFWFPDIFVASAFTTLWALRIICVSHREKLEHHFPTLADQNLSIDAGPRTDPTELNILQLSTWICKSMEYLMQNKGRLYGPISTLFPLRVAYRFFKMDQARNKEQLGWCQSIVDQLILKGVDLTSLL